LGKEKEKNGMKKDERKGKRKRGNRKEGGVGEPPKTNS